MASHRDCSAGFWQSVSNIAGKKAGGADCIGTLIGGEAMPEHSTSGGEIGWKFLGEKGSNDSGENIAHSGGGHSGVSGTVDEHGLIGLADDAVGAFEKHTLQGALDGMDDGAEAVALDFGDAGVEKS